MLQVAETAVAGLRLCSRDCMRNRKEDRGLMQRPSLPEAQQLSLPFRIGKTRNLRNRP
jgi:hypothetical protein